MSFQVRGPDHIVMLLERGWGTGQRAWTRGHLPTPERRRHCPHFSPEGTPGPQHVHGDISLNTPGTVASQGCLASQSVSRSQVSPGSRGPFTCRTPACPPTACLQARPLERLHLAVTRGWAHRPFCPRRPAVPALQSPESGSHAGPGAGRWRPFYRQGN